jgi:hypothetical protein
MSNPTTPFSWQMPTATDLVTDLPADFEVFGQAVATSMADLLGGTTGQILAKNSATDMDFIWTTANPADITGVTAGTGISGGGTSGDVTVTNSMATAIDAKGDLIAGTAADTFSRLAVGANNTVLTADSAEATGLKWATPASPTFSGCALTRTTNLSCANSTIVQIGFDAETFDVDGYHSNVTNNERITIPTGKGGYFLWTIKGYFASNSTGIRAFIPFINGARYGEAAGYDSAITANGVTYLTTTYIVALSAGDYVSTGAFQTSGGTLNLDKDALYQSLVRLGA